MNTFYYKPIKYFNTIPSCNKWNKESIAAR